MTAEILSVAGVVAAALIAFAGARLTSHRAREADAEATRVERERVDVEAYNQAKQTWLGHLEELRGRVDDQQGEIQALRGELASERTAREQQDGAIGDLNRRVAHYEQRIRAMVRYIVQLRQQLVDAGHHPPPAPPEIVHDLEA